MQLLRNPELRQDAVFYSILLAGALVCALWMGEGPGMYLLVAGTALGAGYHFYATRKRYKRLQDLAADLDRVLHGASELPIEQYAEGELAILQNETRKMLLRLQEQTEALGKDKEFLADLIADISHQIRTPLTSLRLFCTLIRKKDLTPEKRQELTWEIQRLLDRMEWLIEALLKMSRLDAGTVAFRQDEVMAEELVYKASELVAIPMEVREQKLKVEMQGTEKYVGDLSWSVEAVGNILKNCMEHMGPGGCIEIGVSENTLYTEIRIQDHGPGILPEDLPHLFERFYRGGNSHSDSIGIGLALAQMIIKEQNGTIQAQNAEDGGAVFTIRFYKTVI